MKIATVDAEFVELRGENQILARGEGSTTRTAIARAIGNLLRDPKVRRKRITHFRATVTIQTKS